VGKYVGFSAGSRRLAAATGRRSVDGLIAALIDSLPDSIGVLDADQKIVMVNKTWRAFCDRNQILLPDYGVGRPFLDIAIQYWSFHSWSTTDLAESLRAVCSGEQKQVLLKSRMQVGPHIRHYEVTLSHLSFGEQQRIIVAHGDATAQADLAEERRHGAIRLLEAQLEDRRRVGRELHDTFAQNIAAIAVIATRLRAFANTPELNAVIDELNGLVEETSREARAYSYLLHPPQLSQINLESVLEQFIAGYSRRTGITISFDWNVEDAERLAPAAPALLRITQEALANVYRHSGAKVASVQLSQRADDVSLAIVDRGVGIGPADQKRDLAYHGVGIASMRARTEELGGTLQIDDTGEGTSVIARFVLPDSW